MTDASTLNVTLSDRAARRIASILAREPDGTALRVSVSGGGCSGFQYGFDLDKTRAEDDLILERVGSSRVDLQACKLEYSIVSPK